MISINYNKYFNGFSYDANKLAALRAQTDLRLPRSCTNHGIFHLINKKKLKLAVIFFGTFWSTMIEIYDLLLTSYTGT